MKESSGDLVIKVLRLGNPSTEVSMKCVICSMAFVGVGVRGWRHERKSQWFRGFALCRAWVVVLCSAWHLAGRLVLLWVQLVGTSVN